MRPSAGSFGRRRVALADHVQMALEYERRRRLAAWGRRHADRRGCARRPARARSRAASAHARTCSITGSSWRDGRAILVSASKCPQKGAGSSPASTEFPVAISPCDTNAPSRHPQRQIRRPPAAASKNEEAQKDPGRQAPTQPSKKKAPPEQGFRIGAPRFELGTSVPQTSALTRLRHAPCAPRYRMGKGRSPNTAGQACVGTAPGPASCSVPCACAAQALTLDGYGLTIDVFVALDPATAGAPPVHDPPSMTVVSWESGKLMTLQVPSPATRIVTACGPAATFGAMPKTAMLSHGLVVLAAEG